MILYFTDDPQPCLKSIRCYLTQKPDHLNNLADFPLETDRKKIISAAYIMLQHTVYNILTVKSEISPKIC